MQTKFLFIFLLFVSSILGQNVSGKYEGFAEVQPFGKLPISGEIRQKADKFSGTFTTPLGNSDIIGGTFNNGNLQLTIDAEGNDVLLDGTFAEGKFAGKVSGETINGNFELNKVGEAMPESGLALVLKQSKEKWREDLRFIAAELPKKHKSIFHRTTREQFEKAVAELDKKIPDLDDNQIIFEFAKIFAMIGDGHTQVDWASAFEMIPIRCFWFGKELRVFRTDKKFADLAGAKLLKIGGVTVEEIFKRSQPFISQGETPQFILSANAYQISFPTYLQNLGITKSNNSAVYEFIDVKGKRKKIELKTVPQDEKIEWVYPMKNLPLWLRNRDKELFFKYLAENETVYVQFQSYPRRKEFKKFSDELFAFIDKNKVKKLVFDLRLNGGGDFTRGQAFFIDPLKERKYLTEKGKLFVIAGRWTYSAGMSNTGHFRNEFGAIIVGEPTGARPNGYQENRNFRLPNSHLDFSVSTLFYTFADKDSDGILPDKLIEPDWKSFQAGKDSALEWVLAYPAGK
jgi:hypothetical protein